jgi:DNA-binding Xre family transcriptional regulator
MPEQRRIGYRWNLRALMAQRNLWKTTELMPLLQSRGISLSESQVYRLVTGTPERIPARTFAALCDILDCTPNDLFEPFVEMRAAATADAPRRKRGHRSAPRQRGRSASPVGAKGRG